MSRSRSRERTEASVSLPFPDDFAFGVATSAYQIEGAVDVDGRCPSVWDHFCTVPGAVRDGHDGSIACDHYGRLAEDVDLIAGLGVDAYRFSTAWPRIVTAPGHIEERGLAFYDRLVDALLERGVAPWLTLFHWDLPLWLHHRGGWLDRSIADHFAEYTEAVVGRLGDRVKHWITFNEPQCVFGLGHVRGVHAPGLRLDMATVSRAIHHGLLAHGRAVSVIRDRVPDAKVGWAPVAFVDYPVRPEARGVAAAATFRLPQGDEWPFNNTWFTDPVGLGQYPEGADPNLWRGLPAGWERDLETIGAPLDLWGLNIYRGRPVDVGPDGELVLVSRVPGHGETLMGWSVDPECLYWGPRFFCERYGKPVAITENGLASMDWVHHDGTIPDLGRVDYLVRHLHALRRAIADGAEVLGYFQWSLMDNFEWELGYAKRFGLVHVDFETLERTPKESYARYAALCHSRGATLPEDVAPLR
ncbi:MAG: beta-glucosidase [Sandaracinus sp.]|nr:beta-glucosidase [Sandaracinus sp.]